MYPLNILEEELKLKVAQDWFSTYDTTRIHGKIDFAVADKQDFFGEIHSYLWAEAKKGKSNLHHSIVQLLLTIGKARSFEQLTPPNYLGAFDATQIGFVPYSEVLDIFYMNDFNWNVRPSDHETKEFKLILERVEDILAQNTYIFRWAEDAKELSRFVKKNFILGNSKTQRVAITKTNFISVYNKWCERVMPTIAINWESAKKHNILRGDFYLADLLAQDGYTIKEQLNVILRKQKYEMNKRANEYGAFSSDTVEFTDGMKAYNEFWLTYERPPRREIWSYFVERRDLLVPQDVRERKGSYFTPRIWVEKAHEYLALEFGDDWQDEYYVWDCAAGTGNLLVGLSNKYNIWASTLDLADVKVMHDRIANGANLVKEHVFQFDFLNDEFDDPKLPKSLKDIISDPEKRKKLIILINPPYAEAGNKKQLSGRGKNKEKTATDNRIYYKYRDAIKQAAGELFALFLIRIYRELSLCKIAEFSTLKTLQSPNFQKFRQEYRAKLGRFFVVPADTFDNVRGQFAIGFKIWHTDQEQLFTEAEGTVINRQGECIMHKGFYAPDKRVLIGQWLAQHRHPVTIHLGMMESGRNDFQHRNLINIQHIVSDSSHALTLTLTLTNIQIGAIFFAVRWCIEADWLNDKDQFYYPNDGWQRDAEFQSDCLAYTLFHNQNRISSTEGVNHWIPFTEEEVKAPERFESHFMTDFIRGKLKPKKSASHSPEVETQTLDFESGQVSVQTEHYVQSFEPLSFSPEAKAVFDAGRELWRYYMAQSGANANASLYDIKAHFQGFSEKNGKRKMNTSSEDEQYQTLISTLRSAVRQLGEKIQPKVYAYGFLR